MTDKINIDSTRLAGALDEIAATLEPRASEAEQMLQTLNAVIAVATKARSEYLASVVDATKARNARH